MDWDQIAEQTLAVTHQVLSEMRDAVEETAVELARRIESGGKILICGNGGSAGDAQHFAGELVNRFLFNRRPYAGIALTTDTSVLTAIGNDFGYDEVFSKQVEALAIPGDALIAISTSGNAMNVLKAVDVANAIGSLTIGMTGGQGGALAGRVDTLLSISCTSSTPRIQEGHGLLIHLLCERIEEIVR